MSSENNSYLIIKSKVWAKENFELVDFDNINNTIKFSEVKSSGFLIRNSGDVCFIKDKNYNGMFYNRNNELLRVE